MHILLALLLLLTATTTVRADSTVPALATGTTLATTSIYGAQGGTLDRKFFFDPVIFGIASGNITLTAVPVSVLTGTMPVGQGGTGASALPANGMVVMNGSGNAQTTVAPGATNNCALSNGTIWTSSPCPTGGGITQLTGDVTAGPGTGSQAATISNLAVTTSKIAAAATTYPKIQNGSVNGLLGVNNGAAPSEVAIGTGLTLSSGTLSAAGGVSITAGTPNIQVSPNPITNTGSISTTAVTNDQSANNYTILTGDNTKALLIGNHTYTLPQAGTVGFGTGWSSCLLNKSGGDATLNTTTSTFIGGGGTSSMTIPPNAWACIGSDGTNYDTMVSSGSFTGTSGHKLPYLDGSNTWSGTQTFGSVVGAVNTQSGTTYTLAAGDCGKTVLFTNASAVTLTTLNSLPAGCAIAVEQGGTGQVTVSAGSGATQHSAHSYTKTFGQYAIIGLFVDTNGSGTAADYIITGDGA